MLVTMDSPALFARLWKTTAFLTVLYMLYMLSLTVYYLFFHPLCKIPGPLLARVSRLWARIGNWSGRKSERIHAAHERYGPVVRVGPNEISFADPSAQREIYTTDVFVKEETFYGARTMFHENHLFSFRHKEAHRQRRKLLARGFSQASMLDFEPKMTAKIETLLDQWAKRSSAAIDIYPWCHWLGFDTVYHLMFDEDPASLKAGEAHQVMRYIKAWRPTPKYKEFFPLLQQWGVYLPGPVGADFRAIRRWKKFASGLIAEVRRKKAKTPFLRNALTENDGFLGRQLTDSELAEESMGGMFGGSGTTANTFVYLVWAVARSPEVKKRLQEELRQALPTGLEVPDYGLCSRLQYTQAVIDETLRRYPTIVATLPRTAMQDVVVQGYSIPKNTIVGCQNYTIHRNSVAFPDPEEFRPERWLEGDEKQKQLRRGAFNPFSTGSRKCVGLNLAQMELLKLTAAFFRRFDVFIDASMQEDDMRMFDAFNAGPVARKLLVHLKQCED